MNLILAIPLPVRLVVLFVFGTLAGALVNWAVYRLAWNRRSISPWSAPATNAPKRRAIDRVPLVGWLSLRRESALQGRGFWVRPMVVELVAGLILAALYVWEVENAARLWAFVGAAPPPPEFLTANLALADHLRYLGHVVLVSLMLAASLIDLDEKTIPDSITVPGTLVALALAALYPWSLPAAAHFVIAAQPQVEFLTLASPNVWPPGLDALPMLTGLTVALACWTLWCGGLLPRHWNTGRGWALAARVFFHRLRVERLTYAIVVMWFIGAAAIALVAWQAGIARWAALVTALVGIAAGGGIVWAVRVIGGSVLGREAMGFGDVTLLSLIGAFLGWQACLMIFFVAPFFGLAFAIVNWVLHREREVPYGPFLCLGAVAVMLKWPAFWAQTADLFGLPWLVPAVIACGLVLLGVLLWIYRIIEQLFVRSC